MEIERNTVFSLMRLRLFWRKRHELQYKAEKWTKGTKHMLSPRRKEGEYLI